MSNNTHFSENLDQIATALSKLQSELPSAKKDNSGYGYNYSDLNTVIETAKPYLVKNGLAVTQLLGNDEKGNPAVTTIVLHSSGQFLKSTIALESIDMKGCNKVQGAGATLSYLRRYAYQAALGMASEDNDASSEKAVIPRAATPTVSTPVASVGSSSNSTATVVVASNKPTETKGTSFRRKVAPAAQTAQQEDDI